MKLCDKKVVIRIIFSFCIALLASGFVHRSFQNDTFFTIPTGNYIIENGVDDAEPFTFHEGLKFIKLRWAFDVLVASLYNSFGFQGLYIFTILIYIIIGISVFWILSIKHNNIFSPFLITLLMLISLSEWITCRAQIISYLIFAIELFLIQKLLETNKNIYIFLLCFCSLLLVNFHSSVWLVYFCPFLAYIGSWMLLKLNICKNKYIAEILEYEKYSISKLVISLILCLITGFITPLGLSPFTYMFKVMHGVSTDFINELQFIDTSMQINIFIVMLIPVICIVTSKVKIKPSDFLLIYGFYVFALIVKRNYLISVIFWTYPITNILVSYFVQNNKKHVLGSIDSFFENNVTIELIMILLFVGITIYGIKSRENQEFVSNSFPIKATEYIKNNLDIEKMRLYTGFDYGSYLEFNGVEVFLDSRSEIYTSEFNNVTILEDWVNCFYDEMPIGELITKYDLTHILVPIGDNIDKKIEQLNDNYNVIYEDEYYRIYEVI